MLHWNLWLHTYIYIYICIHQIPIPTPLNVLNSANDKDIGLIEIHVCAKILSIDAYIELYKIIA